MFIDTEGLKVLSGLTGQPKACAGLAARRLLQGHEVDVQVRRAVGGYTASVTETVGEGILLELSLSIVWADLDEHLRYCLLMLIIQGTLQGAARASQRADVALRLAEARWGAAARKACVTCISVPPGPPRGGA